MLEFRILGPLEVLEGDKALDLGGSRQRAVLALLAIHVGEVVPSERLITYLWGESPPPTAATSLQNAISQLRKSLGASAIETRAPGYALKAEKGAVDARRFEELLTEARTAEPDRRIRLVGEALELWRGPPLADFAYEPFAQNEAGRLEELRLTAIEDRIEAELELGGAAELAGELEALVRENPLRERSARPIHARPLPKRPAGRGAPGVSGDAPDARRGARHRADAGAPAAARIDPPPGVGAPARSRRESKTASAKSRVRC